MPFIPPWPENAFQPYQNSGNHNNTLSLIAVEQLVINTGWRMYTLLASVAHVNSSLCTFENESKG